MGRPLARVDLDGPDADVRVLASDRPDEAGHAQAGNGVLGPDGHEEVAGATDHCGTDRSERLGEDRVLTRAEGRHMDETVHRGTRGLQHVVGSEQQGIGAPGAQGCRRRGSDPLALVDDHEALAGDVGGGRGFGSGDRLDRVPVRSPARRRCRRCRSGARGGGGA